MTTAGPMQLAAIKLEYALLPVLALMPGTVQVYLESMPLSGSINAVIEIHKPVSDLKAQAIARFLYEFTQQPTRFGRTPEGVTKFHVEDEDMLVIVKLASAEEEELRERVRAMLQPSPEKDGQ